VSAAAVLMQLVKQLASSVFCATHVQDDENRKKTFVEYVLASKLTCFSFFMWEKEGKIKHSYVCLYPSICFPLALTNPFVDFTLCTQLEILCDGSAATLCYLTILLASFLPLSFLYPHCDATLVPQFSQRRQIQLGKLQHKYPGAIHPEAAVALALFSALHISYFCWRKKFLQKVNFCLCCIAPIITSVAYMLLPLSRSIAARYINACLVWAAAMAILKDSCSSRPLLKCHNNWKTRGRRWLRWRRMMLLPHHK
jgi:hypothetical protein